MRWISRIEVPKAGYGGSRNSGLSPKTRGCLSRISCYAFAQRVDMLRMDSRLIVIMATRGCEMRSISTSDIKTRFVTTPLAEVSPPSPYKVTRVQAVTSP